MLNGSLGVTVRADAAGWFPDKTPVPPGGFELNEIEPPNKEVGSLTCVTGATGAGAWDVWVELDAIGNAARGGVSFEAGRLMVDLDCSTSDGGSQG